MAVCQFISGIYKDVPTNAGKTGLLTQHHVRDDINKCIVSYLGTEQQQQVSAFIWKKFWGDGHAHSAPNMKGKEFIMIFS